MRSIHAVVMESPEAAAALQAPRTLLRSLSPGTLRSAPLASPRLSALPEGAEDEVIRDSLRRASPVRDPEGAVSEGFSIGLGSPGRTPAKRGLGFGGGPEPCLAGGHAAEPAQSPGGRLPLICKGCLHGHFLFCSLFC